MNDDDDATLSRIDQLLDACLFASAIATGYHLHKGQWRRSSPARKHARLRARDPKPTTSPPGEHNP